MRILSVVTLITPNGDYGGPVRVALNQAKALIARGHDVTVAGAHRGFPGAAPDELDGVPTALFPGRTIIPRVGFAGLASPGLDRWLRRNIGTFDIVHIHAARDFVTLPAARLARRAGVPFVLQTHGMIDPSSNPLARPLDAFLTRPLLGAAKRVFYLTPEEKRGLLSVGGSDLPLQELSNGVPTPASTFARPESTEVLYLARLAPRKRPMVFVETANRLAAEHPEVRFTLVGPDEGEGPSVARAVSQARSGLLTWEGPLAPEETGRRMSSASIYVLPSVDEPFPMSVLEAMAHALPVVITESCGLAPIVTRAACGIVTDESQEAIDEAVRRLLSDPTSAREMGERGARTTREELSMPAVAEALETVYSS
ncbi:glycosyltransferase [Mycetocola manganoxydans]|uniref:D-inositol 3-phosphate glycosyltransferase n=1 Tax=Mycetocola manganoxydans TaxID=699879 RepID=A0A3L6ZLH2_9MICO|nr:glycosyltransferase [Mycetocola manganoxydans]RLP68678.1 glycosyltransferase [Mycetocola manganoxydans]GHD45379.1 glycosyl transferase family 1 [Mycetocola manganoxydans]